MVSLRLDVPGGASAWIHAGRLAMEKRRALTVFTDHQMYHFNDGIEPTLTVSEVPFARRYDTPVPREPSSRAMPVPALPRPMVTVMTEFLDGLSGGDRSRFGAGLALAVVRVLGSCDAQLRQTSGDPAHAVSRPAA